MSSLLTMLHFTLLLLHVTCPAARVPHHVVQDVVKREAEEFYRAPFSQESIDHMALRSALTARRLCKQYRKHPVVKVTIEP